MSSRDPSAGFEPIAIVGRACLLPGAHGPEQLWQLVRGRRSAITGASEGRWRVDPADVMCAPEVPSRDRAWSDRGGYVEGFEEIFDPTGFAVTPERLAGLDPLFLWTLHTARLALRDAGDRADGLRPRPRTAAIFGNLSFPNGSMNRYAEAVWFGDEPRPDAANRFTSSGPAALLEEALSLGAGSYCLDAACASSLVAIKLACDRLQDGTADRVLAGAVNRTDDLFIHIGFCALQAMSRSGRSRPFSTEADGLVPAEGAGFVVLRRLADAVRDGERIHGVIRGVGLSNDGRGHGLLAPAAEGQERALRLAYGGSAVSPQEVSLLECHATGTPVGDAMELRSSAALFGEAGDGGGLPIGSLKSNLGHLVTTAGVAGLIKVLEAMRHGVRPPTLGCEQPLEMIADSPFRLLADEEPWETEGPRTAGISAFGFGGNNAHVIVSEPHPDLLEASPPASSRATVVPIRPRPAEEVAVVGLGLTVGPAAGRDAVTAALESGAGPAGSGVARTETVPVSLPGLRFPPQDLKQSLAQQVLLLETAREAVRDAGGDGGDLASGPRTGVVVGMEADAEIGRYGARWRMGERARDLGADAEWLEAAREAAVPGLEAAGVLGTMPNIPANRLNSQLDAGGFGMTVSAGEDSGLVALEMAAGALRRGEIDSALVGAVDLSCEPVHLEAMASGGSTSRGFLGLPPGDAAIVLVLQRRADAEREGRHIYAVLRQEAMESGEVSHRVLGDEIHRRFGHPYAAAGLLRLAVGTLALDRGLTPEGEPWPATERRLDVVPAAESAVRWSLHRDETSPPRDAAGPAPTPALEFPAHPPAVRLPDLSEVSTPETLRGSKMAKAPQTATSEPASPADSSAGIMPSAPALPSVASSAAFESSAPRQAPAAIPAPSPVEKPVERPAAAAAQAPAAAQEPAATRPAPTVRVPVAVPAAMSSTAAVAVAPIPSPQVQTEPLAEAFRRHLTTLSVAQQHYMQSQDVAHRQFLAFRQRSVLDLGRLAGAGPQPAPVTPVSAQGQAEREPIARSTASPEPSARTPRGDASGAPAAARSTSESAPATERVAPVIPLAKADRGPQPAPALEPAPPAVPAPAQMPAASDSAAPAATQAVAHEETAAPTPVGLSLDREQLKIHASGKISEIFGQELAEQDGYFRQVRMPEPPLLLADRVTGIDAEIASMGVGTIWTETDVEWDSWYLHQGRMPTGIMIESGQADLMLISYVGIDLLNRSDRVYRLLGCELTFHGDLPCPGETLKFDIHLDGHAKQGDVRLMFFHYDCRVDGEPRLTVRSGQAGFFTDEELAESAGVLWTPEDQEIVASPRLDPPRVELQRSVLDREQLEALAAGRPWEAFGEGFEAARAHVRTPRIASGRMLFIDRVTELEVRGGPWGRGYLRAESPVTPEDWFFDGHFKNDPCMPGTLMFEGCLQTMTIFMLGMGFGLPRDGWRFQPVPEERFVMRCRGQVLPTSRHLVYEVFVEEVIEGEVPTLYADLLVTVDGLKAFHARRVGLQLVPDYPMNGRPEFAGRFEASQVDVLHVESLNEAPVGLGGTAALEAVSSRDVTARAPDAFPFDYRSLLACAWGRPSEAFGSFYSRFDGHRQVARLPGPPYHFMSRILRLEGDMGAMEPGSLVEVEYDIPPHAWYLSGRDTLDADPGAAAAGRPMPYAVLLEAGLQPCGWLASYVGSTVLGDGDLMFRNLDGTAEVTAELLSGSGPLRTVAKIVDISKTASLIVESFEVESYVGDQLVQKMDTVFGFFPPEAMANQVGLPTTEEQRALLAEPSEVRIDLHRKEGPWFLPGRPRLAQSKLLMLDRITGLWPEGGAHGKGRIRGEKDVDAGEWFFKAHFFTDPVQPGSLGIEAMIQLLQVYMLSANLDHGIERPRFEPLQLDQPLTWKYRGQVVPANRVISTTMDITATGRDERGAWATAETSLWVDGKRIYEATSLGMRIVSGDDPGGDGEPRERPRIDIDPAKDGWILDHRPTYTVPALPMMSMVDYLAAGSAGDTEAPDRPVVGLRDVRVKGWLTVDRARSLTTRVDGEQVELLAEDGAVVATARVLRGDYPAAPAPWPQVSGELAPSPYGSGLLFHGPAFQILESMIVSDAGASSILNAECEVPFGLLNAGLLDGATHCIPHDQLHRWDDRYDPEKVAFPAWIPEMELYRDAPTSGKVRCEVRPDGFVGTTDFPAFRVQLIAEEGVWASLRLVEACFPKGPIGRAAALDRRAFLRDGAFLPGLGLSRLEEGSRRLLVSDVTASDWLPGTIESLYGTREPEEILTLEHAAAGFHIHPGRLRRQLPLNRFTADVRREGDELVAEGEPGSQLELAPIREFWSRWSGGHGPIEDLYFALIRRFCRRVRVHDPEGFEALRSGSVLYLANHQVGIESLLFTILASGLHGVPAMTLAKVEHRGSWMGRMIELSRRYPGADLPQEIAFFDRKDAASLSNVLAGIGKQLKAGSSSLMVHVEGTRSLSCRRPVENMSGAFVDLALQVDVPIVPVRFSGGLPVEPVGKRLEFPVGMGTQDIHLGKALQPADLRAMHYGQRRQAVMDAINSLGPDPAYELPNPPDADFAAGVAMRAVKAGMPSVQATLHQALAEAENPNEGSRRLLDAAGPAEITGDDPESRWLRDFSAFLHQSPRD